MKKVELSSKIPDLIGMIYDSALESELWTVFLSEIQLETNSKYTALIFNTSENKIPFVANSEM